MTYPPIVILAKEPSHISLLEIFVLLLSFGGVLWFFIIDDRIGLIILLLNQLILYHI